MISLYFHIPFCERKCKYCHFHVQSLEHTSIDHERIFDDYCNWLHTQIDDRSKKLWKIEIRTIHIWWWTPSTIWAERLIALIKKVTEVYDTTHLEELSIELNPYPHDDVLALIDTCNKARAWLPRCRRSIWLQSFDTKVLHMAWRQYSFGWAVDFLRELWKYTTDATLRNFDFIAFWKNNISKKWDESLWSDNALDFFYNFANSHFADSFSVYTLELFNWSAWYQELSKQTDHTTSWLWMRKFGSDDDVYNEFTTLTDIILDAWYQRYEISNFSRAWKNSIHNRVYRSQQSYLGIWSWATSACFEGSPYFDAICESLGKKSTWWWIRRTNTLDIVAYTNNPLDTTLSSIEPLSVLDCTIEKWFLWLRTQEWINIDTIQHIFVDNHNALLDQREKSWLIQRIWSTLRLTHTWMNVYNTLVTELFKQL